jgi:peptidoglycan biosynthesis protein MviN/MurJ (putative lipid II flippase)
MSLKAVHLVFVGALSSLVFGVGLWKLQNYQAPSGGAADLWLALGAFAGGVAVIAYGLYVLKKLKSVSYL